MTTAPATAAAVGLQLVAAIAREPGSAQLDLRLDPPELGHVRVLLDIRDDSRLHATLIAERPATGELMRRHSDVLAAQFRDAGFADVDLTFQQHSQDRPGQREAGGPGAAVSVRLADTAPPTAGHRPAVPTRPAGASGRLDLRL